MVSTIKIQAELAIIIREVVAHNEHEKKKGVECERKIEVVDDE